LSGKLLLIGGGGHCRSVLDCVLNAAQYTDIGIIDSKAGTSFPGVPFIGTDSDIPSLFQKGWTDAFITVGSVGNTAVRRRLYRILKELGFRIPVIIDPSAAVARGTEIREGVFVGKRAVVNAGVIAEECCIINTGAIIEHDCRIGSFAHVSPGAVLCGQVTLGKDSHVGAGSVVRQLITIGEHALIGAGSVVVKDIPDHVTAFGNPCRVKQGTSA